eukprot:6172386-Pleurochrysis_carterae.AAC.2
MAALGAVNRGVASDRCMIGPTLPQLCNLESLLHLSVQLRRFRLVELNRACQRVLQAPAVLHARVELAVQFGALLAALLALVDEQRHLGEAVLVNAVRLDDVDHLALARALDVARRGQAREDEWKTTTEDFLQPRILESLVLVQVVAVQHKQLGVTRQEKVFSNMIDDALAVLVLRQLELPLKVNADECAPDLMVELLDRHLELVVVCTCSLARAEQHVGRLAVADAAQPRKND